MTKTRNLKPWHERMEADYDTDIGSDREEGSQWKRRTPMDHEIHDRRQGNKVIDITIDVNARDRQHRLVSTTEGWLRVGRHSI